MNDLLITIATVGLGGCIGYYIGRELGIKRGRDEQWIANYLANERKTQAGRDNLGRFKKRKAQYGKIKITASKNES
jgi:membrane protein YqaA with SNARE-associated domain